MNHSQHSHHQDIRDEAAEAFQESLYQLEERLLAPDTQGPSNEISAAKPTNASANNRVSKVDSHSPNDQGALPFPPAHDNRLPFRFSSSTPCSQTEDFDLADLQDAAADIDRFIQDRIGRSWI